MKLYSLSLLVCLLLAGCSRQPVRVGAPLPGPAAPASPAPAPDARPTNETADRMNQPMTAPAAEGGSEVLEPTATDPVNQTLPVTEEATNGTANIENQGSIGQAPLTNETMEAGRMSVPLMTYEKSICRGDCNVYTLQILPGNFALLNVQKGLMGKGNYQSQMEDVAGRELTAAMNLLRTEFYQEYYPVGRQAPGDTQFARIVIPDKENNPRSIVVYSDAPTSLTNFINRIDAMVENEDWQPRQYARE